MAGHEYREALIHRERERQPTRLMGWVLFRREAPALWGVGVTQSDRKDANPPQGPPPNGRTISDAWVVWSLRYSGEARRSRLTLKSRRNLVARNRSSFETSSEQRGDSSQDRQTKTMQQRRKHEVGVKLVGRRLKVADRRDGKRDGHMHIGIPDISEPMGPVGPASQAFWA